MRLSLLFSFMLYSIFSFSQIEIVENFDNSNEAPAGWYTNGQFYFFEDGNACDFISATAVMNWSSENVEIATPYQDGISNGTDLSISFNIKMRDVFFWPGPGSVPLTPGWGTVAIEYTTDSTNWVLLETITDQTYVYNDTCELKSYSIAAADIPAGASFQLRIKPEYLGGEWNMFLDNFIIGQVAETIPNCDATLLEPVDGATVVPLETMISWSNATGLPTGYKISIGTTSGGTEVLDQEDVGYTTSYQPTTLEYSNTYYVSILPYNAHGDATEGCTEQSFTIRNPPAPGSSCDNPLIIDQLPFTDSNNPNGFDNNYDNSICDLTYLDGEEVVYELTPTEQISINIRFDSLVGSEGEIHVLDGCPDVAETCLAVYSNWQLADPQYFENIVLEANHSYYIVVANWQDWSPGFDYFLEITQNPCVIPDATYSAIPDCDNDQYTVEVDITRFGSGETLTIGDDQGSDTQQVDTLGIVTFGPYPKGTPVSFTITNDQDNSCEITGMVEFHCPPSNDECSGALEVIVNTSDTCANVASGTLRAATFSLEDYTSCEWVNLNQDVWFYFVATNPVHTIEMINVVAVEGNWGSVRFEVLEGTCGGELSNVLCSQYNPFDYLGGLTVGNTYYIRVYDENDEVSSTFDVCVSTPPDAPANDDCVGAVELLASTDDNCDNMVTGTTVAASRSPENPCFGDFYDVWYTFTPEYTGYYKFELAAAEGYPSMGFSTGNCDGLIEDNCYVSSGKTFYFTAGETTYIAIRSNSGQPGVEFTLCTYQIFPPANNECHTPALFSESTDGSGNNLVVGTSTGATGSTAYCSSNPSVWYTFTPEYTGKYTFNFTGFSGNPYYGIYEGDCEVLTEVSGVFGCYNQNEEVTFDVVAGNYYKIFIHSWETSTFQFFVYPNLEAPANNECAAPMVLVESTDENCENVLSGTTLGATYSAQNLCSDGGIDVWYSFTPANTGYYQFDLTQTSGTDDMFMAIYSGVCDTLENLACGISSTIQMVEAGTTYSVMVSSDATSLGVDFELCAYQYIPPANNDCVGATEITESVDSTGNNMITGTNEGAFNSAEACYEADYEGVWYTFTPAYTGTYKFSFTSLSGDASYTIYEGNCDTLSFVSGIDTCYNAGVSTITVEEGVSYLVSVHSAEAAIFELFVYPFDVVGTNDLVEQYGLRCFPNPVNDRLNIRADINISHVNVYNNFGQRVISESPEAAKHVIEMDRLQAGIYFVKIMVDDREQTVKVVKH